MSDPVIVGEAVAGQATKVKKEINSLIKGMNTSEFTLAELLHEAKSKKYYLAWGYNSFMEYAKSLDLKTTKSYYLVKIVENMTAAGVPREQYEPLGIAKLRVISKLNCYDKDGKVVEFNGLHMSDYIKELTGKAGDMPLEDIETVVAQLQGKTGDDAIVWLNIAINKSARDNTVVPALNLAKQNIGTVGQDEDGNHKEASDGAALEAVAAEYLSDPANGYQAPAPVVDVVKDGQPVENYEDEEIEP